MIQQQRSHIYFCSKHVTLSAGSFSCCSSFICCLQSCVPTSLNILSSQSACFDHILWLRPLHLTEHLQSKWDDRQQCLVQPEILSQ
ncbi:hypothetical protein NP493_33g02025 [Ridgeia piscesae]|uniref:Uncharacterized protein n=1 Tax=Ridgeia piscesae TaxID=27915 RepID=A0AAD9PCQ6_RIDPI|nr:hypothetical protein NP493_33g02025 [Ridgeia piscesae]